MLNRFWNILLVVLLFSGEIKIATAEKFWVEQYELDPTVSGSIFNDYSIPFYKISYSKDKKCLTFYVKLKSPHFEKSIHPEDIPKIYFDILSTNNYLPYALVDEKQDLKINVGWGNAAHKEIIITQSKANIKSTCEGIAQTSKFIDNIKNNIWTSSLKRTIERSDGHLFEIFLFAGTEVTKPKDYVYCDQLKEKIPTRKAPYHIYLYDFVNGSYWPDRIEIFKNQDITLNNIFILKTDPKGKTNLLLAQGIACDGEHYEAYGFTDNHSYIKKFVFAGKKTYEDVYGYFKTNPKNQSKLIVYSYTKEKKIEMHYLSSSKIPGEVKFEPINKILPSPK